jgi:uncharacterized protein (TIRG00374 family)
MGERAGLVRFLKRHPGKIRIAVVIILFGILFTSIHPNDIIISIKGADKKELGIAIALLVPNLLLQLMKWRFVLRLEKPRPTFGLVFRSVFGGFFLAASTPGRTGELARGFLMPGFSKIRIASLTVVDKGFSQLIVYLAGLIALMTVLPFPFTVIPLIVIIIIVTAIFNIHRLRPVIEKKLHRYTHSESVENALAAFDALSPGTVIGMLIYSIVFYLTFTTQFYVILNCYTDVPAIVAIRAVPLIFFINSAFPISIGDFGVKDFAAVQVLGRYHVPGAAVLSSTFTQYLMTFLIPGLIGGIIFSMTKHPPLSQVRQTDDRTVPASKT